MQDIISMIKNMDPKEINDAVEKAKYFMNSEEGKAAVEKLKNGQPISGLPISDEEQSKLLARLSQNPGAVKKIAQMLEEKR